MTLLTKSKYLLGLQCYKLLWLTIHEPDKIPGPDKSTQHRFDQGHLIGELAKKLYPDGIDIPADDFKGNLEKTKELLVKKKPLFEAGFSVNGLFSRADILNPVKDGWDIIEVKSATDVKDVNVHDISFQKYVYELSGLKIHKCYLMHLNNQYVRKGEIDPAELFTLTDVTSEVITFGKGIQERINEMKRMLLFPLCPPYTIGQHCDEPYECPVEECWAHVPPDSVFSLYYGGKGAYKLYADGIVRNVDIPADKLNPKQEIQVWCEKHQKVHTDKDAIRIFLKELIEPLHFFDFETFSTGTPLYDGVKPYQQVPFQFSMHIMQKGKVTHHSFLATGTEDPRTELVAAMKAVFLDKGSIVAYNASFEKNVIKALAEAFPAEKKWLLSLNERFVDLLVPFRDFHYYHPEQHGSASIKKVLPALTGSGYDGMEIGEGGEASLAFLELMDGKLSKKEIDKIRKDLEKYCEKDTQAMIDVLEKLRETVEKK